MIKKFLDNIKNTSGITLIELLTAVFLTGILATASFKFFATIHDQAEVQYSTSEIQLICRNSIQELKKNVRMAGYRLDGHIPFEVSGDTLAIYLQKSQPVDTILYYLQEYEDWEYSQFQSFLREGEQVYKLMKQVNSNTPGIFADCITGLRFNVIDSANVSFSITARSETKDYNFEEAKENDGLREFTLSERVRIRNVQNGS